MSKSHTKKLVTLSEETQIEMQLYRGGSTILVRRALYSTVL